MCHAGVWITEVYLYAFVRSAIDTGEYPASRNSTLDKKPPFLIWHEDAWTELDAVEKGKASDPAGH
jgi:hypothetical protein